MGLSEEFDGSKDQILLMEPLPTVNKVFSLLLKVEKQRTTQVSRQDTVDMAALSARTQNHFGSYSSSMRRTQQQEKRILFDTNGSKGAPSGRGNYRRFDDTQKEKENLKCKHCNMNEHTMNTCFRIHGLTDWYRNLKPQRSPMYRQANSVHVTDMETPLDTTSS